MNHLSVKLGGPCGLLLNPPALEKSASPPQGSPCLPELVLTSRKAFPLPGHDLSRVHRQPSVSSCKPGTALGHRAKGAAFTDVEREVSHAACHRFPPFPGLPHLLRAASTLHAGGHSEPKSHSALQMAVLALRGKGPQSRGPMLSDLTHE